MATALFTLLSVRRALGKSPFAARFLGSWFALSASTILCERILLNQTNALSSLVAIKGTVTFLIAFFLVEFPPTAFLLKTPFFRFFIYLFHSVNKSAGMIRSGEISVHVFKRNAIFASFFVFFCKSVATMLCIDFYAKLGNPKAATSTGHGKLSFWFLPAAIFSAYIWQPATSGLSDDTVGLIITDLVVAYYMISWLTSLWTKEEKSVDEKNDPSTEIAATATATANTRPQVMVVQESTDKKNFNRKN